MSTIGNLVSKINLTGRWLVDEPLAHHTTFRVGGPADVMVFPESLQDLVAIQALARDQNIPTFLLGRGANVLVSDRGIRGITINMTALKRITSHEGFLEAQAGADVSDVAEWGAQRELSCLEFLNGMPSTVGGAVFMNARCYGSEVADVFVEATVLENNGSVRVVPFLRDQWSYKVSPFQGGSGILVSARFRTEKATEAKIRQTMNANAQDRETKGHFRLPCAGSVFKNNHAFGAPSGVLIDQQGLKGLRQGTASVSSWHANIIVNEGGARASDIRQLIQDVKDRVLQGTGFLLEEEVLYVGDWTTN